MPLNPEVLAVTYGVSSALSWGAGDFSGGFAARRSRVLSVVLLSQLLGGLLLLGLAILCGEPLPPTTSLCYGGAAGLAGAIGLIALYRGLAGGRMGIVAPLSAIVTAILPIMVAMISDGLPGGYQLSGFAVALIAVVMLSYEQSGAGFCWAELGLPLVAGTGFGLFFILIDAATEAGLLWPLVSARSVSVCLVGSVLFLRRPAIQMPWKLWPWICLAGVLDTAGNAFFALATQLGRLDISAVLASLYPAATVLLAWIILKERLMRQQWAGVALALFALALITH
jgi:drug/metabolite transporter (DMT)-like permease